jgi:hypothetical protein
MALVRAHLLRLGTTISSRAASCATPAALKAMINAEVAETMAALYDYDDELDLGKPSTKAARLIRRKYCGVGKPGKPVFRGLRSGAR